MELGIRFDMNEKAVQRANCIISSDQVSVPSELKGILNTAIKTTSIDLSDMIKIFEWQCSKNKNHGSEHSALPLLEESSIIIPELPKRERNQELQKRLKKLSAQQENKEYNRMVENVSSIQRHQPVPKKAKSTVISGLNFAVTLFASCFGAIYLLKNVVPDLAMRTGIGLAVGTVLLLIEIYLAVREIERQDKRK